MPHGDELAEEWECFRTSATNATHCVRLPAMEPSWSLRAEGTDGFTTDQLECRDLETKEAMGTQPPPPPPPPRLRPLLCPRLRRQYLLLTMMLGLNP